MFTVASARADTYSWTNFQSDIPGVAQHVDPNLVNPWGMAASTAMARFGSATTAPVSRHSTIRMAPPIRWSLRSQQPRETEESAIRPASCLTTRHSSK